MALHVHAGLQHGPGLPGSKRRHSETEVHEEPRPARVSSSLRRRGNLPNGHDMQRQAQSRQPVCEWYDDAVVKDSAETCEQLMTREDCESIHADYPVPATYKCAWAVETKYARGEAG
jgi:hypothetical protein